VEVLACDRLGQPGAGSGVEPHRLFEEGVGLAEVDEVDGNAQGPFDAGFGGEEVHDVDRLGEEDGEVDVGAFELLTVCPGPEPVDGKNPGVALSGAGGWVETAVRVLAGRSPP